MDRIVPFFRISRSIGSCVSKIQRRATDIAEIVTPTQRIYIAMGDTSGGYSIAIAQYKITPHLLPELLMALRANDADGLLTVLISLRQVVIELIQD